MSLCMESRACGISFFSFADDKRRHAGTVNEIRRDVSQKAGRERLLPQGLLGIRFPLKDGEQKRAEFTDLKNKTNMYFQWGSGIACVLFQRFVSRSFLLSSVKGARGGGRCAVQTGQLFCKHLHLLICILSAPGN